MSHALTTLFSFLALPWFLGAPSLIGVFMSFGLAIYITLRRWEHKNQFADKENKDQK